MMFRRMKLESCVRGTSSVRPDVSGVKNATNVFAQSKIPSATRRNPTAYNGLHTDNVGVSHTIYPGLLRYTNGVLRDG